MAGPYGTPGTGALWLSIFGFVCGIPAILGIVFGIGARREAKQRGRSPAKANWAIGIGLAWIILIVSQWGLIIGAFNSSDSTDSAPADNANVESVQESARESVDIADNSPITQMASKWQELPAKRQNELCEVAMNTEEVVGAADSAITPSREMIRGYNVGAAALEFISSSLYEEISDPELIRFFNIRCAN